MFKRVVLIGACFCTVIAPAAHAMRKPPHKPLHDNCTEEIQRGVASWYGPGFEGLLTKSEEVFDPNTFTAAHPTLPFGTRLKVVNMRNHQSVMVKVNDRGGFGKERAIDLSEAAAREIGMIDSGTTAVAIYRCHR